VRAVRGESGQATVELAFCLPVLALVFAGLVETSMVAVDQVRVWHAAREAARASAVEPDPAAAREAASGAGLSDVDVSVEPGAEGRTPGSPTKVHVSYAYDSRVPLIGAVFERIVLEADATMRIERP
jgi:Flp pilus assembly protein TadG